VIELLIYKRAPIKDASTILYPNYLPRTERSLQEYVFSVI